MAVESDTLRAIPMFAAVEDGLLRRIAAFTDRRTAAAGAVLFNAGDRPACLFVPLRGRVALGLPADGRDDFAVVQIVGPVDPFGIAALLTDEPYARTARALDDIEFLCVEAQPFKALLTAEPSLTAPALLTLARQHYDILGHAAVIARLARRAGGPEEPPTTTGDASPRSNGWHH